MQLETRNAIHDYQFMISFLGIELFSNLRKRLYAHLLTLGYRCLAFNTSDQQDSNQHQSKTTKQNHRKMTDAAALEIEVYRKVKASRFTCVAGLPSWQQ